MRVQISLNGVGSGTTHTSGYRYYAGLRLEEGGYPTIPFDSLKLTNDTGSKIDNLGEIVDAGGWDLLGNYFCWRASQRSLNRTSTGISYERIQVQLCI